MKKVKFISILICLLGILFIVSSAYAQTVTGARVLPAYVNIGEYIDVSVSINIDEGNTPNGLVIEETIPIGWLLYTANQGGTLNDSTGVISWVFFGSGVQDTSISYQVYDPSNIIGTYSITGNLFYTDPANGYADTITSIGGDSQTTLVPEPISSTLFIVGGATFGFRRFCRKRKTG